MTPRSGTIPDSEAHSSACLQTSCQVSSLSPLISGLGERQYFLRLAYHLARLAPHLYPRSLVQAVAAPCLRAGRWLSIGTPDSPTWQDSRPPHLAFRFPKPGQRHERSEPNVYGADESRGITTDMALRGCLLILCELVILAPEYIRVLALHAGNGTAPSSNDSVVIQALMSTFAASPTVSTVHSSRIHQAVISTLLYLMNIGRISCSLLSSQLMAKFFVPFSSLAERALPSTGRFDTYPSFSDCAKLCLIRMLRSWPGVFYFLQEGLPCLQTLMYSLAVGTTEMRNHILDLLYGLFPTIPVPHGSVRQLEPAIRGLLDALLTCSPFVLPVGNASVGCYSYDYGPCGEPYTTPRKPIPMTAWNMTGGFVASEGLRLFAPCTVRSGATIDLVESHTALLLATLVQAGLYEGLVRSTSDLGEHTSVRAGLLLGLLAYKAGKLFPLEHPAVRHLDNVGLLQPQVPGSQSAVIWLERVHRVMYEHDTRLTTGSPARLVGTPPHSPFLECLARQSRLGQPSSRSPTTGFDISNRMLHGAGTAWIDQVVIQSGVVLTTPIRQCFFGSHSAHASSTDNIPDPNQWDWDLLAIFGRQLLDTQSKIWWEDKMRIRFLRRLMEFITPLLGPPPCPLTDPILGITAIQNLTSSTSEPTKLADRWNLAWLPHSWRHAAPAAILVVGLIPHLAIYPTNREPGQLLTKFLSVVRDALAALDELPDEPVDANGCPRLFDTQHLTITCSSTLLLAVGRLTCSDAGELCLTNSGLYSVFHSLLLPNICDSPFLSGCHLSLAKVLLSSLDLTRPNRLGFKLFSAAVTGTTKHVRLYLVQLIRLLFRLQLPFIASWGVDLVVKLCTDTSTRVARRALCLLEELSWDPVNVQALTRHILTDSHSFSGTPTVTDVLTPFGLHLLSPTIGHLGHRILACLLFRHTAFEHLAIALQATRDTQSSSRLLLCSSEGVTDISPQGVSVRCPSTPVDWMLDMAEQHFNRMYAVEVDRRLSTLLGGPSHVTLPKRFVVSQLEKFSLPPFLFPLIAGGNPSELTLSADDDTEEYGMYDVTRVTRSADKSRASDAVPGLHTMFTEGACLFYASDPNTSLCCMLPKHLYGCLAEHTSGLNVLIQRGALQTALDTVNSALCIAGDHDIAQLEPHMTNVKASLWALAHVGVTSCGQQWVAKQPGLIDAFQRIAVEADSMGLRATAWLCLNLLAATCDGAKLVSRVQPCRVSGSETGRIVWIADVTSLTAPLLVEPSSSGQTSPSPPFGPEVFTMDLGDPTSSPPLVFGVKFDANNHKVCRSSGRHGASGAHGVRRFFVPRFASRTKPSGPITTTASPSRTGAHSPSDCTNNGLSRKAQLRGVESSSGEIEHTVGTSGGGGGGGGEKSQSGEPIYASLTWSHTDLASHRQSILDLTVGTSTPPESNSESTAELYIQPLSYRPHVRKGICLPLDIRSLGYLVKPDPDVVSLQTKVNKLHLTERNANSNRLPTFVPVTKPLMSFIQVSAMAETVLQSVEQLQTDKPQASSFDTSDRVDPEGSTISDALTTQTEPSTTYIDPIATQTETDTEPSSVDDSVPDSNKLRVRITSTESTIISANENPDCLFRRCRHPHHDFHCNVTDEALLGTSRDIWCSNLYDVITDLMSHVSSGSHNRLLGRLIDSAHKCASPLSDRLFDACVYTQLAQLLATYTFPLDARIKIQTAFLGLELPELLMDAKDAVSDLEQFIQGCERTGDAV